MMIKKTLDVIDHVIDFYEFWAYERGGVKDFNTAEKLRDWFWKLREDLKNGEEV